jgi:hypothetical protein
MGVHFIPARSGCVRAHAPRLVGSRAEASESERWRRGHAGRGPPPAGPRALAEAVRPFACSAQRGLSFLRFSHHFAS